MFAENVTHFARVLRRAGVPVGPDRVIAALEAIEAVGFSHRDDVHAALSAVMLDRHEQQEIFDQAFDAFWRDPKLLEQMMALLLPKIQGKGDRERARAPTASPMRWRRRAATRRRKPAAGRRRADRLRDELHLLRPGAPAVGRLRVDDGGGIRARQAHRRGAAAAAGAGAAAPPRGERPGPDRPAPDDAGDGAPAADDPAALQPSRAPSCRP